MSKCPLTGDDCPEHNKKDGCQWWLSYTGNTGNLNSKAEGCALVITPMLLLENANCLGLVAREVYNVSSEISASRVENIKENEASRIQLLSIASGKLDLVNPNHTTSLMKGDSDEK